MGQEFQQVMVGVACKDLNGSGDKWLETGII